MDEPGLHFGWLNDPRLATHALSPVAVWLWGVKPTHIVWANPVGAAVFDVHGRLNFPNRHPLNLSCHKEIFGDADLIVSLDTRDWEKSTHFIERTERRWCRTIRRIAR